MTVAQEHKALDHLHRIETVLARAYRRNGHEEFSFPLPLSSLQEEEIESEDEAHDRELKSAVRQRTFELMLDYIYADGPHPGSVMRRVYALARAFRPELIAEMNGTDLARMFDESRAAQSWRVSKIFDGYLKGRGAHSGKMPFQRGNETRRKLADASRGNRGRQWKAGKTAMCSFILEAGSALLVAVGVKWHPRRDEFYTRFLGCFLRLLQNAASSVKSVAIRSKTTASRGFFSLTTPRCAAPSRDYLAARQQSTQGGTCPR